MAPEGEMEVIARALWPHVRVNDLSMHMDLNVSVLGVHNLFNNMNGMACSIFVYRIPGI